MRGQPFADLRADSVETGAVVGHLEWIAPCSCETRTVARRPGAGMVGDVPQSLETAEVDRCLDLGRVPIPGAAAT